MSTVASWVSENIAITQPLLSAEWNGFVKNPYGSSLIDFEEAYEGQAMQAYRIWLSLFELYRYYSWIIDRFHISTQMWQAAYRGRKYRFKWLESRLFALGFRLIFCWRHPSSFAAARRRRRQISSNPSQYDNLAVFIREQVIIQELVEKSSIPKLLVDVTERSLEEQVSHIADWLEATGGLNPAESPPNPKNVLCPPTTWRHNYFADSFEQRTAMAHTDHRGPPGTGTN